MLTGIFPPESSLTPPRIWWPSLVIHFSLFGYSLFDFSVAPWSLLLLSRWSSQIFSFNTVSFPFFLFFILFFPFLLIHLGFVCWTLPLIFWRFPSSKWNSRQILCRTCGVDVAFFGFLRFQALSKLL